MEDKRQNINNNCKNISIRNQCKLLNLSRSSLYYKPRLLKKQDLEIMNVIDDEYTKHPSLGIIKMTTFLNKKGYKISVKKVRRLTRTMGIMAIYPKLKRVNKANLKHKIYPYLLKNAKITQVNQVWSADITYIKLTEGFIYLVAILDWHSRYVLNWRLSNSLEVDFCIEALTEALEKHGKAEIFNTDQGSQFTSNEFTEVLLNKKINISMDGKGRAFDNIFIERLWRTVKYEEVYIKGYQSILEAKKSMHEYFEYYNYKRYHQALNYKTPAEIYFGKNLNNND